MILAADVGGTSARIAVFDTVNAVLRLIVEETYASSGSGVFGDLLEKFLEGRHQTFEEVCIGIAGPVRQGVVQTPNLPWVVDARALGARFGFGSVVLINDLEANAWGIAETPAGDLLLLNQGVPGMVGNAALISAGTGLGEAGLYYDGTTRRPVASEGGHADFAPRNALQCELMLRLSTTYGHVSSERLLSGSGLKRIYDFLRDTGRGEETLAVAAAMRLRDPAAVIADAAMSSSCGLCVSTLDLFCDIYGAAAGNLALKFMAVSGLYIGGGIAPKIAAKLQGGRFMAAFVDKGRMSPLLQTIPVRLLRNPKTALLGAARCALERISR